jgi:hypothetical protein
MSQQLSPATNEFDAAKAIAEILKQLDRAQQERAIRFASESLGLAAARHTQPANTQAPAPGTVAVSPVATPVHSTDIKQFTEAKAPKSDQQFAAVAAYFYQFEAPEGERKEAINMEDLKNAARLAKRKVPGRLALNNAKNSGYLDSAGRGLFRLNTVGENLVAITLPEGASGGAGSGGKAKKAQPKRKTKKKSQANKKAKRGTRRG